MRLARDSLDLAARGSLALARQQAQLFRRMVFNILIDNTDDHEKNHALLRQADGSWTLSPAFDVVPGLSGLGYQALVVGQGRDAAERAGAGRVVVGLVLAADVGHPVRGPQALQAVGLAEPVVHRLTRRRRPAAPAVGLRG